MARPTNYRNIADIKPNPKNPRVIKDEKYRQLMHSLATFPEMLEKRPLVCFTDIDGKLVVLGGNMRLKAATELGMKTLPVTLADDWTEEQRAEFLIKDNVGFGEWNWEDLQADWDVEKLGEWGLDIPQQFLVEPEATEDDYEIPDEIETDIVLGDLFEIGEHRLLCGDSTDSDAVGRLMDGQKADMVFTDPPYGISKKGIANDELEGKEFYQFSSDYISIAPNKDNCGMVCYHSTRTFYHTLNAFIDNGWKFEKMLFFYRPDKMPVHTWNGWMMTSQAIMLFSKGDPTYLKVSPAHQDVYRVTSSALTEGKVDHPTVKPITNCVDLMNHYDAELIYEPFLGSGSTMVAANQLNRKCYGMELDPKYCQVILDRMRKLDPSIKILKNGHPI